MKNLIKKAYLALMIMPAIVLGASLFVPAHSALAVGAAASEPQFNKGIGDGASSAKGKDQSTSLFGDNQGSGGVFQTVTNILLFIIGAVAVIMLIIGGIRYTTSGGDQGAVQSAKNTILYAVVGIVVAILAFAVVNFVITGLTKGGDA